LKITSRHPQAMTVQPGHSQLDSDRRSDHLSDRQLLGVASLEVHTETLCDPVEAYFECITTCSLDDGECITTCTELLREQV